MQNSLFGVYTFSFFFFFNKILQTCLTKMEIVEVWKNGKSKCHNHLIHELCSVCNNEKEQ